MKKWIFLIAILAGCNTEEQNLSRAQVPGRLPDMVTDSGIFIYVEAEEPGIDLSSASQKEELRSEVENLWISVQLCLDMSSTEPPALVIVDDVASWLSHRGILIDGDSLNGRAQYDENIIIVKPYISLSSPQKVYRHEMIHIILHQNGIPNNINSAHQPDYLWGCQFSSAY